MVWGGGRGERACRGLGVMSIEHRGRGRGHEHRTESHEHRGLGGGMSIEHGGRGEA